MLTSPLSPTYCLKPGYVARATPPADVDPSVASLDGVGKLHQPQVYELAAFLGERFGCRYIIDVGCGKAEKLLPLKDRFSVLGFDFGANLAYCRQTHDWGTWFSLDFDSDQPIDLPVEIVSRAVVICADVIEHVRYPERLLARLRALMDVAPVGLLSSPERDLVGGPDDMGPPANVYHLREWNQVELTAYVTASGLRVEFSGLTINNNVAQNRTTTLLILGNAHGPVRTAAPADFTVTAIMSVFNEADVIEASLHHLIRRGVSVYLIDNWSTDETVAIARQFLGKGLLAIEQYPPEGRSGLHWWHRQLTRIEAVAQQLDATWVIFHDADEYREPPWPEMNLRDAFYYVDQCGFNCVDFTLFDFHPIDNGFRPGSDFAEYFQHGAFGRLPGHFRQIKAWKQMGQTVTLAESGGHVAAFAGMRVFPYKFLLRHYRLRSEEHALRKLYHERTPHADGLARGWHTHYGHFRQQPVLRRAEELTRLDAAFYNTYLAERLSGVGVPREMPE